MTREDSTYEKLPKKVQQAIDYWMKRFPTLEGEEENTRRETLATQSNGTLMDMVQFHTDDLAISGDILNTKAYNALPLKERQAVNYWIAKHPTKGESLADRREALATQAPAVIGDIVRFHDKGKFTRRLIIDCCQTRPHQL